MSLTPETLFRVVHPDAAGEQTVVMTVGDLIALLTGEIA